MARESSETTKRSVLQMVSEICCPIIRSIYLASLCGEEDSNLEHFQGGSAGRDHSFRAKLNIEPDSILY